MVKKQKQLNAEALKRKGVTNMQFEELGNLSGKTLMLLPGHVVTGRPTLDR